MSFISVVISVLCSSIHIYRDYLPLYFNEFITNHPEMCVYLWCGYNEFKFVRSNFWIIDALDWLGVKYPNTFDKIQVGKLKNIHIGMMVMHKFRIWFV